MPMGVLNFAVGFLLLAYPAIVYFSIDAMSARGLALLLMVFILLRMFTARTMVFAVPWGKASTLLGGGVLLASAIWDSASSMLFYPVAINLAMLIVFTYSIFNRPTVIETLARLQEPDLDEKGIRYTANVTKVWCGFFVLNGTLALFTALHGDFELWALYNGLVAYLAMAILFAGEWLVRRVVQNG